jgi:hypothetical protein
MDDYFITKKAVEIILENINEYFIKCLVNLSINDRYLNDIKLILEIIELLKTYMTSRRNDILSSCIKYTNKSYYLQLTDSLFRIIQAHLTIAKQNRQTTAYVFIYDLIDKYNNPVISNISIITRNLNNNNTRTRFDTFVNGETGDDDYKADDDENKNNTLLSHVSKDAGTLFREAYYQRNKTKNNYRVAKEVELQKIDVKNCTNIDLL